MIDDVFCDRVNTGGLINRRKMTALLVVLNQTHFRPAYSWVLMGESFQDYSCFQDFEADFP